MCRVTGGRFCCTLSCAAVVLLFLRPNVAGSDFDRPRGFEPEGLDRWPDASRSGGESDGADSEPDDGDRGGVAAAVEGGGGDSSTRRRLGLTSDVVFESFERLAGAGLGAVCWWYSYPGVDVPDAPPPTWPESAGISMV